MTYRQITFALLGLALVTFLTSGCVDFGKMKQLESENARLNQLILQKDASLKTLTEQAQAKQIELEAVKKELDIAKNGLDSVKKELDGVNQKLNTLTTTPVVPQQ
jgi:septal ring factor EnvC (AmiA/AmiB activator)